VHAANSSYWYAVARVIHAGGLYLDVQAKWQLKESGISQVTVIALLLYAKFGARFTDSC
jgi:hypothetical protein